MGCAPKNSARFAGLKSISSMVACTSTAQDGIESVHPLHGPELRALRPLQGKSPYVFTTEAGTPVTASWFLRMVSVQAKPQRFHSQSIPTCCAIQRGTSLLMTGTIRARWRTISGIETCRVPRGIPRLRQIGLRSFGRIEQDFGASAQDNVRLLCFGSFSHDGTDVVPLRRG